MTPSSLSPNMARILVLLLLTLFAYSAYSDIFASIDCGASDSYLDPETSILWSGDELLFPNSQSFVVQSTNDLSKAMSTLRVFTTRKKNCYSMDAQKGERILIRASFFYGNYDKKSSPPSFDLHFDGNDWLPVETTMDSVISLELVYVVKSDTVSVCLAQTKPEQFPFISALEFRSLGPDTYSSIGSDYALYLLSRVAYGANNTVRFPNDAYDRIWHPVQPSNGLTSVNSDAIFINTVIDDNPPQEVLKTAITTTNASYRINLGTGLLAGIDLPVLVNMYFSEVTPLDSTQIRSFQIYINGKSASEPILPNYEGVNESIFNITANGNTTFSLVPTNDSTLPPLINAKEMFYVSGPLSEGTNSKDLAGLKELQTEFVALQDWYSDPCLPSPYTWDWVNCSDDAIPRITALYLNGYSLLGSLPDFSSMEALEIIDLHNNSIEGSIPEFLGNLPNLKQLNLADNIFSGPIPESITSNKNIKLVVSGNPDLCESDNSCQTTSTDGSSTRTSSGRVPRSSKKKNKLPVILGVTIPIFLLFWSVVGFFIVMHNKRKREAIAAATTGNVGAGAGGANGTSQNQQAQNNIMMGKIGGSVINEIKMNIQDETTTTETNNQTDSHSQQHGN